MHIRSDMYIDDYMESKITEEGYLKISIFNDDIYDGKKCFIELSKESVEEIMSCLNNSLKYITKIKKSPSI